MLCGNQQTPNQWSGWVKGWDIQFTSILALEKKTAEIWGVPNYRFFKLWNVCCQVAGSFWYLLTVQRVESCLSVQCDAMTDCPSPAFGCPIPIAFHHQPDNPIRLAWAQNSTVQSCLTATTSNFSFGIYQWAVPLVSNAGFVQKILYPLFWGVMTFRWGFFHTYKFKFWFLV